MPIMAKIQTKTKTAVGIALATALVGTVGFAAGLHYYSYRGQSLNCECPKCQTCSKCPACPKCGTADTSTDTSNNNSGSDTPADSEDAELGFTITSSYGTTAIVGTGGSSTTNQSAAPYAASVTNSGKDPAGPFKVKTWISTSNKLGSAYKALINTWDVPGLASGQTLENKFSYSYGSLSSCSFYLLCYCAG